MIDAHEREKNERLRYVVQVLAVFALVLLGLYLLPH